jgi:squalene synthase HpnC
MFNFTFKYIFNYILEEAYKFCESVARSHYENFPVASFFIPKNKRKYIYNIYAFARLADDIADSDSLSPVEKTIKLDKLDKELKDCFENVYNNENNDQLNIFKALHNTAFELNINADEFSNLLKAFKQDAVKQRYDKFEELIEYSNYSANPIGHLVLNTFGYHSENDEELFRLSDNICTGLQLINFWQDVGRDLEINRIYIPFKEMQKFNYSEELLLKKIENDDFINLIKSLVEMTKEIFNKGKGIEKKLTGRLKLELKAIYNGGNEIIKKIEKINYKVLSGRVEIKKSDKMKLVLKTIIT